MLPPSTGLPPISSQRNRPLWGKGGISPVLSSITADGGLDSSSSSSTATKRRRGPQWFKGLKEDLRNRLPLYKSDWVDGMKGKTIPTILFLYFACLAPAVAFGGISYGLTQGKPPERKDIIFHLQTDQLIVCARLLPQGQWV